MRCSLLENLLGLFCLWLAGHLGASPACAQSESASNQSTERERAIARIVAADCSVRFDESGERAIEVVLKKGDDQLLEAVGHLHELSELSIYEGTFTAQGFQKLSRLSHLAILSVEEAKLTEDCIQPISKLKALEELSIVTCGLRGTHFAGLRELRELLSLKLGGNPLTDESMYHVARCTRLHYLSVSDTPVGDEGFQHLRVSASLTHLHARRSNIGDQAVRFASQMRQLEELDFNFTKASAKAIYAARSLLPECNVQHDAY